MCSVDKNDFRSRAGRVEESGSLVNLETLSRRSLAEPETRGNSWTRTFTRDCADVAPPCLGGKIRPRGIRAAR